MTDALDLAGAIELGQHGLHIEPVLPDRDAHVVCGRDSDIRSPAHAPTTRKTYGSSPIEPAGGSATAATMERR